MNDQLRNPSSTHQCLPNGGISSLSSQRPLPEFELYDRCRVAWVARTWLCDSLERSCPPNGNTVAAVWRSHSGGARDWALLIGFKITRHPFQDVRPQPRFWRPQNQRFGKSAQQHQTRNDQLGRRVSRATLHLRVLEREGGRFIDRVTVGRQIVDPTSLDTEAVEFTAVSRSVEGADSINQCESSGEFGEKEPDHGFRG